MILYIALKIFILLEFVACFNNDYEANVQICGSEHELVLHDGGPMSSAVITLEPGRENRCNLTVKAPASHLVHVQFHEADLELHRTIINKPKHPSCNLDIYLPDNPNLPVWSGDLCSVDHLRKVDLLSSDIRMTWNSANNPLFTKGRKIILTAIGQNDVCNRNDQHICMRIGWMPTKCISKHLACNGHMNCPQGSTTSDEDESLCQTKMKFKEFVEFFKKQINPNGVVQPNVNISTEIKNIIIPKWKIMRVETSTRPSAKAPFSEDDDDNKNPFVGGNVPWIISIVGIIIICLLCFAFYMVKRPRLSPEEEDHIRDALGLGISQTRRISDSEPPNYDDLDQPPSYHSLFPTKTEDSTTIEDIPMERINNQSES